MNLEEFELNEDELEELEKLEDMQESEESEEETEVSDVSEEDAEELMKEKLSKEERSVPTVYVIFIILTAVAVLAVLAVFIIWLIKDMGAEAEKQPASENYTLIQEGIVAQYTDTAQLIIEAEEERKAAEQAAQEAAGASDGNISGTVEEDKDLGMVFDAVNEVVTAKDATNLRDIPSQGEESTVIATLRNGETVNRIGISSTGWSKVEYNGQVCYAVSSLLTTDLTVKPQEEVVDDGIKTVFTDCNERVSPKIEVNLRTLPSVTNPEAQVVATIRNGEIITRTGVNADVGWSRVEYNGQVLYCISSYVYVVEE